MAVSKSKVLPIRLSPYQRAMRAYTESINTPPSPDEQTPIPLDNGLAVTAMLPARLQAFAAIGFSDDDLARFAGVTSASVESWRQQAASEIPKVTPPTWERFDDLRAALAQLIVGRQVDPVVAVHILVDKTILRDELAGRSPLTTLRSEPGFTLAQLNIVEVPRGALSADSISIDVAAL